MEETILKAMPRTETPRKVRNAGFIPGVLNESDTTSSSVQFNTIAVNKVIAQHGSNAKLWVELGNEKRFGFINEIQRQPVEGNVIHLSIKLISKDQKVKMHLPIAFHGRDELEHKFLQVQLMKSEIEVEGDASLMPDAVLIDISKKEAGEHITAADFQLSKKIKILDSGNEIYAVIKRSKEDSAEEAEEAKPTK